jgi:hypothetical protein
MGNRETQDKTPARHKTASGRYKKAREKAKLENRNSKMGKRETQEPTRKKPAWGNQGEKPKVEMRKWKFENGEEGNPRAHPQKTSVGQPKRKAESRNAKMEIRKWGRGKPKT